MGQLDAPLQCAWPEGAASPASDTREPVSGAGTSAGSSIPLLVLGALVHFLATYEAQVGRGSAAAADHGVLVEADDRAAALHQAQALLASPLLASVLHAPSLQLLCARAAGCGGSHSPGALQYPPSVELFALVTVRLYAARNTSSDCPVFPSGDDGGGLRWRRANALHRICPSLHAADPRCAVHSLAFTAHIAADETFEGNSPAGLKTVRQVRF